MRAQTKRISAYRVAALDMWHNELSTTKNLLPSQVAEAIRSTRSAYPQNYIFVYKVQVDQDEENVAIIEPGKTLPASGLVERFEQYEVLPDNRVQISCEFGTWIYGGSWNSGEENLQRAHGVVSTKRHAQYWKTVSPFHISREQD